MGEIIAAIGKPKNQIILEYSGAILSFLFIRTFIIIKMNIACQIKTNEPMNNASAIPQPAIIHATVCTLVTRHI